jgi:hypothetical protein
VANAIKLNELTKVMNLEKNVLTFKHLLALMSCNPPTDDCLMDNCTQCPEEDVLQEDLQDILECNTTDAIKYNQWLTTTDRCNLDTVTSTSDEFVEKFISSLKKLNVHDFVAHQQSSVLKETKSSLPDGEVIVLGDFSENSSFIIQDAAQGFHWNNQQATVHPFVSYLKNSKNKLENLCFIIISECLYHDTVTVYAFQKQLIEFLKENVPNISKTYYFSDGASAQHKNKNNFINLCHHNTDFGIMLNGISLPHHMAKGPCDGVGGTIKRLAACSTLQHHQILTPAQLYSWAREHFHPYMYSMSATVKLNRQDITYNLGLTTPEQWLELINITLFFLFPTQL